MRSVSFFEIQRLHHLGPHFLAKLFGLAELFFYTDSISRVIHMWLRHPYHGLPERNLLRSTPQRSEVQTPPLFLHSLFFLCSPVVWPSAVVQRELLFRQAQRESCAKFFCQQKTYISCFIDVATVTIIKFMDWKGTCTVFILGAKQQLLSLHRRQQFVWGRNAKFVVFSTSGTWEKAHSSWSALLVLRFLAPVVVHPHCCRPLCLPCPPHIQNTESGAVADIAMVKLIFA